MARPKTPLDESVANDIIEELRRFSVSKNTVPGMRAWWRYMTGDPNHPKLPGLGYKIPWTTYRYWWTELRLAGRIRIEKITGAVIIDGVKVNLIDQSSEDTQITVPKDSL